MAGAIGVAAALLARSVQITCPHCGHVHRVDRKPAGLRTCPRCWAAFPDPIAARQARRRGRAR
jgi:ribosomal protein L37AE/L43A